MSKSILQKFEDGSPKCLFCGRNGRGDPLDKHHVFGGAERGKSEHYGLWVYLCHSECHENGKDAVHMNARVDKGLKAWAQKKAMKAYGWDEDTFRIEFGKSYLADKKK